MTRQMRWIALFTLLPAGLILIAVLLGGFWAWAALAAITAATMLLDHSLEQELPPGPTDGSLRAADVLSVLLALVHFAVLLGTVWSLTRGPTHGASAVALALASGLFMGQISNSNAHELIHRSARGLRRLGRWVYISLLFGHHASAHVLVHHVHVATDRDPNSARRGESYWHFLRRAWIGSFRTGLEAENKRRHSPWRHPYTSYVAGGALWSVAMLSFFGPLGLLLYFWLCAHAVGQLLLSDYVQHYGLRREMVNGRPEPVSAKHSWDSRHKVSAAMMLNAPRHSDHHAHPMRPYPQLELPPDGLSLPYSLPVMGAIALVPRRWRALMDPRLP